jgi:predicted restriction endonuclease
LNPKNGLCLNALHDRAFDRYLMWIEDDFIIRFAPRLHKTSKDQTETIKWLTSFEGARLLLPRKFTPDLELLKRHGEKCLANQ